MWPTRPWAVAERRPLVGGPVIWNLEFLEFWVLPRRAAIGAEIRIDQGRYTGLYVNIITYAYGIQHGGNTRWDLAYVLTYLLQLSRSSLLDGVFVLTCCISSHGTEPVWLADWLAGIWPFFPPPLSPSMVIHHVCLNHCSSSSLFYYSHYQDYGAIHVSMQGFAHIWKIMEGWHVTDHLVSHIWLPRCSTDHLGTNIQLRTLIIICIVCMYIRAFRYIPWDIN